MRQVAIENRFYLHPSKPAVKCYVKNHHLGFTIPYSLDGDEHQYLPDFIVRLDDGHGPGDLLNLIVEVTGEKRKPPKSLPCGHCGCRR